MANKLLQITIMWILCALSTGLVVEVVLRLHGL